MNDAIAQAGAGLAHSNTTTLHPVGVSILAIALLAGLLLPRRHAVLPLLALLVVIPSAQRVVIATLDFNLVRLMLLGMLFRITVRNEWRGFRFLPADYLLLAWAAWSVLSYATLWGQASAAITRSGYMIEAVGAWFVARALISDFAAVSRLIRALAWLAMLSMVFFLVERATGRNVFAVFGGVPEITLVRDGRLRCQGPFSHPIMAGVFWATPLPLFAAWGLVEASSRWLMAAGGIAALVIVVNTASSTPAMAVLVGGAALALYPVRSMTPAVRLAVLALIPVLHLLMENGVHHLLARINIVGGSTGWHRYHLMDGAIKHFGEWAAVGTKSTAHWGWGLEDVTNQYVLEGVRGGVLALALFGAWLIAVFVLVSKRVRSETHSGRRLVVWACGSMLFAHCLNFIAVSFFGQMVSAFFVFTGLTASLACVRMAQPRHRRGVSRSNSDRSQPAGAAETSGVLS